MTLVLEPQKNNDLFDRIGVLLSDALWLADAANERVLGVEIEDARCWAMGRRETLEGGLCPGSDECAGRQPKPE